MQGSKCPGSWCAVIPCHQTHRLTKTTGVKSPLSRTPWTKGRQAERPCATEPNTVRLRGGSICVEMSTCRKMLQNPNIFSFSTASGRRLIYRSPRCGTGLREAHFPDKTRHASANCVQESDSCKSHPPASDPSRSAAAQGKHAAPVTSCNPHPQAHTTGQRTPDWV